MAAIHSPEITSIGVHEPNKLGITSGANAIYAETGSNPRDTKSETTGSHGLTIEACKQMYRECGFELQADLQNKKEAIPVKGVASFIYPRKDYFTQEYHVTNHNQCIIDPIGRDPTGTS